MFAIDPPERPAARAPGRLSQALIRLLTKRATVVTAEPLADRFRLITLEGPALEAVSWTPGQKIQIAMGSAFVARTYTPIEWNPSTGRACILGYAHGGGPGSAWVREVEPGDICDIFGPRPSLDACRLPGPLAIFGDETSIGLAYALVHRDLSRNVTCHLEVGDAESDGQVLRQLGLDSAELFARRGDDAHLEEMEAALLALAGAGASFVLTGKASTIQRLRQSLKRQMVASARIVSKAYWAPGKAGLD
ncbi:siderophore-interacting protein [Sphingomonas sp. DG1-23]|uniref:siderophore-interacting protein n=1 Tax=Sphingomonas sp. DG1-23 TaxID=3068316 RepID=UPI00273F4E6C|nr:siderophore-interacting protein [Sphingomonas sp. DG1-23]MDP5280854.1 siderophore-interacting protein [Sphingomonas sp. DG1-23]